MLSMWTIYDHPTDYPDHFVARRFELDKPTSQILLCETLEPIRDALAGAGLICFMRDPSDDPKIVETWM
jgi:hypothetical protein